MRAVVVGRRARDEDVVDYAGPRRSGDGNGAFAVEVGGEDFPGGGGVDRGRTEFEEGEVACARVVDVVAASNEETGVVGISLAAPRDAEEWSEAHRSEWAGSGLVDFGVV